MKKTTENKTSEAVDNYVILASITLLASFSIILNNTIRERMLLSTCILISVLSFVCSLLLCLWHRVRSNIRMSLFELEKEKIIRDYAKEMAEVLNNPSFRKMDSQDVNAPQEKQPTFKVILSFCKNMGGDLNEASNKFFRKPLKESFAFLKFLIDMCAGKFRHSIFGFGLLFYLLVVLIKLFSEYFKSKGG